MTIYFAGTERDAVEGGITVSTTSTYHDPNYSQLSVQVSNSVSCGQTLASEIEAGGNIWLAWSLYTSSSSNTRSQMCLIYNDSNQLVAGISNGANTSLHRLFVYNNAGASAYSDFAWSVNNVLRWDLNIYTSGGVCYADLYRNNILVAQASLSGTTRATRILEIYSGSTATGYVSEIIIADEPTLGMRVKTYRPTADGTHTTWAGNYDNVNNDDVGIDAISTQLANAAETFLHGANLNEGTAIRALCVGAAAASEDPAGAHGVIYAGGTMHQQAFVKPLSQGAPPNVAIWETNPATGLAWTPAEFNALEFGVQHT